MKAKKCYFKECHVAGRQYHDANEVWGELKGGTRLWLVRDEANRYDPSAVAIVYRRPTDERNCDPEGEEFVLGYIPRDENRDLACFFDMGWSEVFECRLSRICPDSHYEQQLHVIIKVLENRNRR